MVSASGFPDAAGARPLFPTRTAPEGSACLSLSLLIAIAGFDGDTYGELGYDETLQPFHCSAGPNAIVDEEWVKLYPGGTQGAYYVDETVALDGECHPCFHPDGSTRPCPHPGVTRVASYTSQSGTTESLTVGVQAHFISAGGSVSASQYQSQSVSTSVGTSPCNPPPSDDYYDPATDDTEYCEPDPTEDNDDYCRISKQWGYKIYSYEQDFIERWVKVRYTSTQYAWHPCSGGCERPDGLSTEVEEVVKIFSPRAGFSSERFGEAAYRPERYDLQQHFCGDRDPTGYGVD